MTSKPIRLFTNFMTLIPNSTFLKLLVVSMEHLKGVWHASRERLPCRITWFHPFLRLAYALNNDSTSSSDQFSRTCHDFSRLFVLRPSRKRETLELICPSVPLSVCPSVRHKNFNLAHIFRSINDRALIFGMHDPCDKPFRLTPCSDLDLELWPTSRSKLLPGGGPQFSEFACFTLNIHR